MLESTRVQWRARLTNAASPPASMGSSCSHRRELQSCRAADATLEAQKASNSDQSMPSRISLPRR
ncbi:hypothetical protein QBC32DRAFT_216326 [Pseudoneurospora amorphoporcata]|uniref:Uncharacterized protein n=1 Tax=Pseudoneurospora amorphoporcata TaxID=241081 RepID=A0AAN6NTQ0_9PEZI|nr:hypothetical protein QBC32DRAFT_216326 [Pseudoneurospora amorphoporcata]